MGERVVDGVVMGIPTKEEADEATLRQTIRSGLGANGNIAVEVMFVLHSYPDGIDENAVDKAAADLSALTIRLLTGDVVNGGDIEMARNAFAALRKAVSQ